MRSAFDERPLLDERVLVAVSRDDKLRLYRLAARRRVSAATLVRHALSDLLAGTD